VGLGHNSCPHPLGNNSEFHALTLNPNASGLARRDPGKDGGYPTILPTEPDVSD
jgi:hypothetical protein